MNELKARIYEVLGPAPQSRNEIQVRAGLVEADAQQVLRALRSLMEEGKVLSVGSTRGRRYTRAKSAPQQTGEFNPSQVALSFESEQALHQLSRPVHQREPVGYQRSFLDDYVPGKTEWIVPEVRSRLAALGRTPAIDQPAGTWARHVLERFLLDLSWNSSRLEGNTYSRLDTERLLATGDAAEGKDLRETQMLLNHKAAIEYLVAEPMVARIDARTIKTLHALLMENLLGDRLDEGRLRSIPVHIGASVYIPLANPQLIDECFRQLLFTAERIVDPFEASFFLFAQLPYLQPFIDGNKRTARLAANLPFVLGNRMPLSFAEVPRDVLLKAHLAVYELNRIEPLRDLFIWAYERSAARLGEVRSTLDAPDPLRLKYRTLLREVVTQVVSRKTARAHEEAALRRFTEKRVAEAERPRFLAMAELELENLHEGNFARYGLRPSQFEAWLARK